MSALIRRIAWLPLLLLGANGGSLLFGEDVPPTKLLESRGLVCVADKIWLLPRELELKDRLAELPKRRERIIAGEKELEAAIDQNLRVWQESRAAVATLKQKVGKLAAQDPKRAVLERQLDEWEQAATDPAKVGSRGDVRAKAIELASERCALQADVAWIRDAFPAIKAEYARQAADQDVLEALRSIAADQRLGPQRNYQADVQRLAEYQRLAATDWTPIFLQAGVVRVQALVDEAEIVTFSWSESLPQAMVLTSSAAAALELEIPSDAPRETITLAGRKIACRRANLAYLRLGQCLVRGVEAYILPPEAEDCGNWLGRTALAEHQVRLERERLRMWIDR